MPDLISNIQSITRENEDDNPIVEVEVIGPKIVPDGLKELRARARSLVAIGAVATTTDTVVDVTVGEVDRLTKTIDGPIRTDVDPNVFPVVGDRIESQLEAVTYKIEVNRHGSINY